MAKSKITPKPVQNAPLKRNGTAKTKMASVKKMSSSKKSCA